MENKLPEHIHNQIIQWAGDNAQTEHSSFDETRYVGLVDGANEYAQQCQQMAEALESLLKYRSDNGYLKRGLTIGAIRESYERYNEAILNAETLLATWNEGMEPNKNTTNDTNNQTSKKTLL